jgi:hypothetical protein
MPTFSQGHRCPQIFAKRLKHPWERMSPKISLQKREKEGKMESEREKGEREKEKGNADIFL